MADMEESDSVGEAVSSVNEDSNLSDEGKNGFKYETLNPSSSDYSNKSSDPHTYLTGAISGPENNRSNPELSFRITLTMGAGLRNPNNTTCFINVVLQCLTYTKPLVDYLQSGQHKASCRATGFCALCAIQSHVSLALESTGRILEPKYLLSNLRRISNDFKDGRQEDAHEYMIKLLESMHKCCLPSGVPSDSVHAYEISSIHKIFGGRLRSEVKCVECSNVSRSVDPFLDLSLEIYNADSLSAALENYTAQDYLDSGAKQYRCPNCHNQVQALKQLRVFKAPKVLAIHLKRFASDAPNVKIRKKIAYSQTLDLMRYVAGPNDGNLSYTLYGVLVHKGQTIHSGHYYCFVRITSGTWYRLDDNQVVIVNEETVFQQKAYMLFYVQDQRYSAPMMTVDASEVGAPSETSSIPNAIMVNDDTQSMTKASLSVVSEGTNGTVLNALSRTSFQRIGAGLRNIRNTCSFLNVVLQCLTYTGPLAAYLLSRMHKVSFSEGRHDGFCALCAMQSHVCRALATGTTGKILDPKDLVSNLRCISKNFTGERQEDAHEYMINLLESMHRCCLPSGVPSASASAYETSLIHKIFGGLLRSKVTCVECSFPSDTFDPFLDLSLDISDANSLFMALKKFTAQENLDGGGKQYDCQRCKQKVQAHKKLTVDKAPEVLAIHLKRFKSDVPGVKIDKKIEYPLTLDLKRYVTGPYDDNLSYTLYGVLVHAGWTAHSGHYYCFVRITSGLWYRLDDDQVVKVKEETVLQQKAYMLFYVRDLLPRKDAQPKQKLRRKSHENKLHVLKKKVFKGQAANVPYKRVENTKNSRKSVKHAGNIPAKLPLQKASAVAKIVTKKLPDLGVSSGLEDIGAIAKNITFSMPVGDLKDVPVPRWNGVEAGPLNSLESGGAEPVRISYVGDECHTCRDQEYDCGKRKIRQPKLAYDCSN